MSGSSYRTILRSTLLMGGAQVVNILSSLAKMKVAAVLLGPVGVGLYGIYTNLFQTAASIASLGIGNAGIRQLAAASANDDARALALTRRTLFWGTALLAITGGVLFWLGSGWIARIFLADQGRVGEVKWLAIAVSLSIATSSQSALLTGLHKISDLAKINVGAALTGAILGVLLLGLFPEQGLIAMILVVPVAAFLLGSFFIHRLRPRTTPAGSLSEVVNEWRSMAGLGIAFMVSGLLTLLGQLSVRTLVQRQLGSDAQGQFQAAWTVGMTYLGVIVSAMATDYYPRLTAAVSDRKRATRLVNEQTEVALLLCAPLLLILLGLSPWVISLLYSSEFAPAVEVLRWQLLGDIPKVMSFPVAFVLLAAGAGKLYLFTETLGAAVLVAAVLIGLPSLGIAATGVAYLAMYLVYLPVVLWLGRRMIAFRWTRRVWRQVIVLWCSALAVDLVGRRSDGFGAVLGIALAVLTGYWAVIRLSDVAGLTGTLGRIAGIGRKFKRDR